MIYIWLLWGKPCSSLYKHAVHKIPSVEWNLFTFEQICYFCRAAKKTKTIRLPKINEQVTCNIKNVSIFQGEESNSSANKCMLKVALYAAQLENYERAIQIYEQVSRENLWFSILNPGLNLIKLLGAYLGA